jgi:hypothetical protein
MKRPVLSKLGSFLFVLLFLLINSPFAQDFVSLTDEQWVELALDMIRKGIQQQDTTKILRVVSAGALVGGQEAQPMERLSFTLQSIFNSSHQRANRLQRPAFPRADSPLHLSNLWDFDILDPKIEIDGDSAVVECELVLWGAAPATGSSRAGKRAEERFVFRRPPDVEKTPPSGDYHRRPVSSFGGKQKASTRSWKLARSESLLDFLSEAIASPRE